MRQPHIVIADSDEAFAQSIKAGLEEKKGAFRDLHVHCTVYQKGEGKDQINFAEVDSVITDPTSSVGKEVLERLNRIGYKRQVIDSLEIDPQRVQRRITGNRTFLLLDAHQEMITRRWDRSRAIEPLRRMIRGSLRIPISLSVIGMGNFGGIVVEDAAVRPDSYAHEIRVFSSRKDIVYEKLQRRLSGSIIKRQVRMVYAQSLEEALAGSDVALICPSARLPGMGTKVARLPDRSDLFASEAALALETGRTLEEVQYRGLVYVVTNPVHHWILTAYRAAQGKLEPGQISSSMALTDRRIIGAMKMRLDARFGTAYDPEMIERWVNECTFGLHGLPYVGIPQNGPIKEKITRDLWGIMWSALGDIQKAGKEVMEEADSSGVPYLEAQYLAAHMFGDLTRLRANPEPALYRPLRIGNHSAFVALPSQLSYSGGVIRVEEGKSRLSKRDIREFLKPHVEKIDADVSAFLERNGIHYR